VDDIYHFKRKHNSIHIILKEEKTTVRDTKMEENNSKIFSNKKMKMRYIMNPTQVFQVQDIKAIRRY